MWVLILVLCWPLVEIGLFVEIGGRIGLWPTLAWVMLTAFLGMAVMRWQVARQTIALRDGLNAMRNPLSPVARGAMGLLAGGLLILPGFLTDALGLLLLLPPVQTLIIAVLSRRMTVVRGAARPTDMRADLDVIEGEWTEADPSAPQSSGPQSSAAPAQGKRPSGWTQD